MIIDTNSLKDAVSMNYVPVKFKDNTRNTKTLLKVIV